MKKIKFIKDLKINKGTKVLLRLDFNVPVSENGKILETFRIDESIPTIKALQRQGSKLIIIAHRESGSLEVVGKYLQKVLKNCSFLPYIVGSEVEKKINQLKNGEVILLENLRSERGEKENDEDFAKTLARYGDVFINDAFSASHRKHASVVGVPKHLPSALGPLFQKEIKMLSSVLKPSHPFLFLLGGAKFETKLNLLESYMKKADYIFVGGALAHNFFLKYNYEIGTSLYDEEVHLNNEILSAPNILLPYDVVSLNEKGLERISWPFALEKDEKIVDFGQKTVEVLTELSQQSETILWNGPMGLYEKGFDKGTRDLLIALGNMKGKKVILGGGDTVAVVNKLLKKYKHLKYTHISTGGGAMIDYLAHGTLPGIEAVK